MMLFKCLLFAVLFKAVCIVYWVIDMKIVADRLSHNIHIYNKGMWPRDVNWSAKSGYELMIFVSSHCRPQTLAYNHKVSLVLLHQRCTQFFPINVAPQSITSNLFIVNSWKLYRTYHERFTYIWNSILMLKI